MSDFFGKLKSGAGKVAFEADKMARLNKAQSELGQIKKQIEVQYLKLGELVYHQHQNQEADSPLLADICTQIAAFEQQLAVKAEEIQHINADTFSAQPAPAPVPAAVVSETPAPVEPVAPPAPVAAEAPQTKFCTNCGKEMPVAVKFCPDCGTKMS